MSLESQFPAEAQERIAAAVRQAEARSSGQVVPVVVERSEPYEEARWIAAVVAAALVTGLVEVLRWEPTIAELFALQILGGVLGWIAGRLALVERLLAGKGHQERAVQARAEQAFFEHGLHETRDGTGVLIFASLRERRAVVIGDRGIHARMGDDEWKRAVEALVEGMRRDSPGEGFVAAIAIAGARLEEHFPRRAGEIIPNELPDGLKRES
jgi:putative membrane protein